VIAASSCCLPLLPFLFAAGAAGASAFVAQLRPYLLVLSVLLIAFGFYKSWRAKQIPVGSSEHIVKSVLIRISSATIHSRGRDSCSGFVLLVRVACSTVFGQRFSLVSMVSINLGIWFYGVELGDAGETIEPEESQ
jgi:hypothetical protein